MNAISEIEKDSLEQFLLKPFIQVFEKEVDLQKKMLSETAALYDSYYLKIRRVDSKNGLSKYINETNWLKESLFEILQNEFPEKREISSLEIFNSFFQQSEAYISQFPKEIVKRQKKERFTSQAQDEFLIKLLKGVKYIAYSFTQLPKHFINLFKKNKSPIEYWKHKVPLRSMIQHGFVNQFFLQNLVSYNDLQQLKCDALNLKWNIDKDLNEEISALLAADKPNIEELLEHIDSISKKNRIDELKGEFDRKLKNWEKLASESIATLLEQFNKDVELVDTIELDSKKFSSVKLNNAINVNETEFKRIYNGWSNTLVALIDDFQIDIELYLIKYESLLQFNLLQNSCSSRVSKTISDHIHLILNEFETLRQKIKDTSEESLIVALLNEERNRIKSKLETLIIPNAIEALYNQNLPNLIGRLEVKVTDQVSAMKESRVIYGKENYQTRISKSELSHFKPKSLVEFELLNPFSKKVSEVQAEVNRQIELIKEHLNDLIEIVDFNLSTASESAHEKNDGESAIDIAIEGLDRTKAKTNGIELELKKVNELIQDQLREAVVELGKGSIALTKNENILALRIKLAKAQAVKQSKDYKNIIVKYVNTSLPIAIQKTKLYLKQVEIYSKYFGEKLGLLDSKNELTAELSDFLSQTEKAIEKLPYVYRKLYQIKPLEEDVLFVGRTNEVNSLKAAFTSWQKGNYSVAALIGEKGSGRSSIINLFKKELNDVEVFRSRIVNNLSSEKELLNFFKELLQYEDDKTFEQLVSYLTKNEKRAIILEDTQHLFLKRMNGFEALNVFFELVLQTSESVFWVSDFTSYSWSYLEKTISIGRYFKFIIQLDQIPDEKVVSAIMLRHRISGYNLQFENKHPSRTEIRNMRGLTSEEKQEYLKKSFFQDLNEFAKSNISLALLYWLRSTNSLNANTIVMGKIDNSKFNFLNKLPSASIFTLHTLLLNDSLNIEEHASIFHQSSRSSRMNLMVLEDQGILELEEDKYSINRFLYRQVVNMLRNKNILH